MIPAEAVEAAAKAAAKDEDASNWDDEHEYYRNGWRNRMQVGIEAAAPHMHAYLLAELADREGKLARVEALAAEWDERWGRYSHAAAALGPQSIRIESAVKAIRAAVAAAGGGGDRG